MYYFLKKEQGHFLMLKSDFEYRSLSGSEVVVVHRPLWDRPRLKDSKDSNFCIFIYIDFYWILVFYFFTLRVAPTIE